MGTAATFVPLMEALSSDRHVIAIDLPGAGLTYRNPAVSSSLFSISRCVSQVLEATDLDQPVLVGHSHGGAVALHLAASEPKRVRGLVLLAPAHPYFRHADQLIGFYLSPLGKLFAHTLPWYPEFVHMLGLRHMAGPKSTETRERLRPYRENLRVRGTVGSLLRLLGTWHTDMRELRLLLEAAFRLPTLLLWGDHDRAVPASTATDLAKHLRCAKLHILPGVGHRPAEENPELCVSLIEAWLRQRSVIRKEPVSAAG